HKLYFSNRRRHTISKRDWSSDVCSSDLAFRKQFHFRKINILLKRSARTPPQKSRANFCVRHTRIFIKCGWPHCATLQFTVRGNEIGRASCRERVYMLVGALRHKSKN